MRRMCSRHLGGIDLVTLPSGNTVLAQEIEEYQEVMDRLIPTIAIEPPTGPVSPEEEGRKGGDVDG